MSRLKTLISRFLTKRNNFLKVSTPFGKQQPRKLITASVLKKSESQHLSIHLGPPQHQPSFKSLAELIGNSYTQILNSAFPNTSLPVQAAALPPFISFCREGSCQHLRTAGTRSTATTLSTSSEGDGNILYYCQLLTH